MATIRKRPRNTPPDVRMRIEELCLSGYSPKQALDEMSRDERYADRLPEVRTAQRICADRRTGDRSEPWSLPDSFPDEARLLLPVLNELIQRSNPMVAEKLHLRPARKATMTKGQARVCLIIRSACPDLDPWWAYRLAVEYLHREAEGEDTSGLDVLLAIAPWRDTIASERFGQWGDLQFDPETGETVGDEDAALMGFMIGIEHAAAAGREPDPSKKWTPAPSYVARLLGPYIEQVVRTKEEGGTGNE